MGSEFRDGGIDSDNGGPFHSEMIRIRKGDPAGEEKLRAFHERMRSRIGDEAFERHMRTQELMERPRELTDVQKALLRDALAPIVRDLEVTGRRCRSSARSPVRTWVTMRSAHGSRDRIVLVRASGSGSTAAPITSCTRWQNRCRSGRPTSGKRGRHARCT